MALILFTIGFVSILGQVGLLRELNVAFYGVELIYLLAMGLWLLWSGTGALIGRRRRPPSTTWVHALLILFAVLLPVDAMVIRWLRVIAGGIPGTYLPIGRQLIAAALVLCPIGVVLGLLFRMAAHRYVAGNRTLAAAYAIESAGGLLGGLVATLLLSLGVQNLAMIAFCSLSAVTAVLVSQALKRRSTRQVLLLVTALPFLALLLPPSIDRALTRVNHPDLLDTRDSPYGRITVTRRGDQFVLFENDALTFETQNVASEEIAHLGALHCAAPERVLILGGGLGGLLAEILKHAPQQVDYVELNATLLDEAKQTLPRECLAPLESVVVRVHVADPREFIATAPPYDLILVGMPDPASGLSGRFYTQEFFARCAAKLRRGGVLAFRLSTSENIWTRFVIDRNASIIGALRVTFPDVRVFPASANIVVASPGPLPRGPDDVTAGLQRRGLRTRLITPAYINYLYTNDRFAELAHRLESTPAPPNTDARPVCYRYAGMVWLSKFIPALINRDFGLLILSSAVRLTSVGILVFLVAGGFLMVRRRRMLRPVALVGVAGFAGMILESCIILHYQVTSGALYLNVGILLMAVMAGLAMGAPAVGRLMAASRLSANGGRVIGYGLLGAVAVIGGAFGALMSIGLGTSLLEGTILLVAIGALVSGLFAYASLCGVEQQNLVGPLYGADLLGGFAGAVLGSLVLIPFSGLVEAAQATSLLAMLALVLI
ncbi:MAG: hypothetical protein AB1792_08035 [Candidatus Zixiibacteriota bacterium]